jgi:hypothetical protein
MTFFYDLNKRLAALASKQDEKQISEDAKASAPKSQLAEAVDVAEAGYSAKAGRAGKDLGKPGKNFSKIAKDAGKRYGSKEAGERVAGAVLNKLRHPKESVQEGTCPACDCAPCKCDSMDESALQAYIGDKKYGKKGMDALRKAGREHAGKAKMDQIRNRYDKMDEADLDEVSRGEYIKQQDTKAEKTGKQKFNAFGQTFNTDEIEEGFADMDAWLASREKEKGTGRFDKRKVSTGTVYTRKPETFDDPETDPEATGGAPKRRGRPKGKDKGPERVTAKSYKYKAGRPAKTQEDLDSDGVMMTRPSNMSSEGVDHGEYDREGDMAKEQMHTIMSAAKELHSILRDEENLPEWVQKKITLAKEYIDTARDYMLTQHAERAEEQPIAEKAVSVAQRRAAGIAHAAQKGEIPKKELRGASKEMAKMPKGELKKFAKTKETGLPKKADEGKGDGNLANNAKPYDKVTQGDVVAGRLGKDEMGGKKKKEDKVDETTVAGSVATAPAAAKKSSGGMQFGKGVYEGFNNQVESMITEGMNISVNMNAGEDGETRKSITVSADGAEADQLAALLKMAGLQGQPEQACGTCGASPCGCEQTVDEAYGDTDETLNNPDWPTDTETLAADPNLRTYSGGLNGPKSTGQTTIPVVASQERRLHSESVELERNLFNTWKNYKG